MTKSFLYKAVIIISMIAFLSSNVFSQDDIKPFSIGIEGGYFAPKDANLKDLYGSGSFIFGGSISYIIAQNWELISDVNFYSDKGKTTLTEEDIELSLNHLRFGGYYHFNPDGLDPIVGLGLDVCWISELNPINDFNDTSIGWFAGVGVETIFISNIKAALNVTYTDAKSEGDLGEISLGGFHFTFGLKMPIF
jgi:opacity protein-like surface antigen